jgi:hypothetical protein
VAAMELRRRVNALEVEGARGDCRNGPASSKRIFSASCFEAVCSSRLCSGPFFNVYLCDRPLSELVQVRGKSGVFFC